MIAYSGICVFSISTFFFSPNKQNTVLKQVKMTVHFLAPINNGKILIIIYKFSCPLRYHNLTLFDLKHFILSFYTSYVNVSAIYGWSKFCTWSIWSYSRLYEIFSNFAWSSPIRLSNWKHHHLWSGNCKIHTVSGLAGARQALHWGFASFTNIDIKVII